MLLSNRDGCSKTEIENEDFKNAFGQPIREGDIAFFNCGRGNPAEQFVCLWLGDKSGAGRIAADNPDRTNSSDGRSAVPGQRRITASAGTEGQAAWVYVNPNVQWSNYKQVMLKPVEFWDNPDSGVSPDDQKMLCSYFFNSLQQNLQKNFTLAKQPGPGVITIQVAIINAEAATPGLRSVSVVIPQARILNYAQSVATGHAAFAGSAEAAFRGADSTTGQLLGESVDKRIDGMAVSTAAQVQWGDAEAAMDYWAQRITQRAVALGAGTPAAGGQASAGN